MLDSYNRNVDYLRISVTDRCNLRCQYCIPEEGVNLFDCDDILKFEEIKDFVNVAVKKGIKKVRLTGGEPLVREGTVNLVSMLSKIEGINDLSLTTNGTLLNKYAVELKNAGLQRINISLDTLSTEKYKKITKNGNLSDVLKGIEAVQKAGFRPIKINCVVENSSDEKDAREVAEFCKINKLEVRFIHKMNLKKGEYTTVEGGKGGNCKSCNRLRLTANGKLKPCLFNDIEFDIRKLGYEKAIKMAIKMKPEFGKVNNINEFSNIGG